MKILLFILVLFGFLFISQEDAFAQKKSKKIETWQVSYSYLEWTYCKSNGYPDDRCIEKMKITFENFSEYHVSSITFMLKIKSPSGTTLYKKKHTVTVDLDPGEKAPCKEFYLKEKVFDGQYGFSDSETVANNIDVEILSVK